MNVPPLSQTPEGRPVRQNGQSDDQQGCQMETVAKQVHPCRAVVPPWPLRVVSKKVYRKSSCRRLSMYMPISFKNGRKDHHASLYGVTISLMNDGLNLQLALQTSQKKTVISYKNLMVLTSLEAIIFMHSLTVVIPSMEYIDRRIARVHNVQ